MFQDLITRMKELDGDDPERDHSVADKILLEALYRIADREEDLEIFDLVGLYGKVSKWYA